MPEKEIIATACDHAGFELKEFIKINLPENKFVDFGTDNISSVDYPDYADKVCDAIKNKIASKGILICGSGVGMSIAANRYSSIRAAICNDKEIAELARKHNDANIIVLGARFIQQEKALECVNIFLKSEFEGQRHLSRINKLL